MSGQLTGQSRQRERMTAKNEGEETNGKVAKDIAGTSQQSKEEKIVYTKEYHKVTISTQMKDFPLAMTHANKSPGS